MAVTVTVTCFAYGEPTHGFPLHRTATVGAVWSATSVNDAGAEVRPAAFVTVTPCGPEGAVVVPVKVYVRAAPVPIGVKPAITGNAYDVIPDSGSPETAVRVKLPLFAP